MSKSNKLKQLFSLKKLFIPIGLGLIASFYLLWENTDWSQFFATNWTFTSFVWIFIAFLMMVIRDLGYIYRIRVLTDYQLNWRQGFDVIMLWEAASAITPSVIGGTGIALFILKKEGIPTGKSTALVMITALLDELFYVVTVPLVIILIGTSQLFPIQIQKEMFGILLTVKGIFVIGYGVTLLLAIMISFGVFVSPTILKKILLNIFKLPFLKKWEHKAEKTGNEIINASREFKSKSVLFWVKSFGATLFSWTARFWVVNFLILAFTPVGEHFLIYGRQLVMWMILLISPTPGGTGIAEFVFSGFLKDFIPIGLAGLLAVLWRIISYYPYLFIGALVLPNWIKRVYS